MVSKLSESIKMLLNLSKLVVLLVVILFSESFAKKEIKKVSCDYTEFNRKTNTSYFYGNIKIELENGYVLCDKAVYKRSDEELLCESNVYCVLFSTKDNSKLEVRSSYLKYNVAQKIIVFDTNVNALYEQNSAASKENEFRIIKLWSQELILNIAQEQMFAKKDVLVESENNKIVCVTAKYFLKDKILEINNEDIADNNMLEITSGSAKFKFRTCTSKTAKIDISSEKIFLNGSVRIVF
ncbi:MAG: hypothetical protein N2555_01065 [Endomicrobia bacterium]|nr:hypothetical protein [Endomicrobiia bacterium]